MDKGSARLNDIFKVTQQMVMARFETGILAPWAVLISNKLSHSLRLGQGSANSFCEGPESPCVLQTVQFPSQLLSSAAVVKATVDNVQTNYRSS